MNTGKSIIPPFLSKLWEILEDRKYFNLISWDITGKLIELKQLRLFSQSVLPIFFKHANFTSFLRQLNMYHFYTVHKEVDSRKFQNPQFQRDSDLTEIAKIKRKAKSRSRKRQRKQTKPRGTKRRAPLRNASSWQQPIGNNFNSQFSASNDLQTAFAQFRDSVELRLKNMSYRLDDLQDIACGTENNELQFGENGDIGSFLADSTDILDGLPMVDFTFPSSGISSAGTTFGASTTADDYGSPDNSGLIQSSPDPLFFPIPNSSNYSLPSNNDELEQDNIPLIPRRRLSFASSALDSTEPGMRTRSHSMSSLYGSDSSNTTSQSKQNSDDINIPVLPELPIANRINVINPNKNNSNTIDDNSSSGGTNFNNENTISSFPFSTSSTSTRVSSSSPSNLGSFSSSLATTSMSMSSFSASSTPAQGPSSFLSFPFQNLNDSHDLAQDNNSQKVDIIGDSTNGNLGDSPFPQLCPVPPLQPIFSLPPSQFEFPDANPNASPASMSLPVIDIIKSGSTPQSPSNNSMRSPDFDSLLSM